MPKYWKYPEKTSSASDEALSIPSRAIATTDDESSIQIGGPIKRMLIRDGKNVLPRWIEDFIYIHTAIEPVEVVGLPDDRCGEDVCAWIKYRERQSAIREEICALGEGKLGYFQIPCCIKLVHEFSVTMTGEAQNYLMRDPMARAGKDRP